MSGRSGKESWNLVGKKKHWNVWKSISFGGKPAQSSTPTAGHWPFQSPWWCPNKKQWGTRSTDLTHPEFCLAAGARSEWAHRGWHRVVWSIWLMVKNMGTHIKCQCIFTLQTVTVITPAKQNDVPEDTQYLPHIRSDCWNIPWLAFPVLWSPLCPSVLNQMGAGATERLVTRY